MLSEQGRRTPVSSYDVTAGKDMPTWSTSLFAVCDNPQARLMLTPRTAFAIMQLCSSCERVGLAACVVLG